MAFFLALVTSLLMIAGILFLYSQPLFWTCSIACLYTISETLGPISRLGISIFSIFVLVALWSAVGLMVNVHRLQKDYPDFLTTEKLKSRTRREGVETSPILLSLASREAPRVGVTTSGAEAPTH